MNLPGRNKKMPAKVLYNLDNMVSPRGGDPTSNIFIRPGEKNRISRDRMNVSPSGAVKDVGNLRSKSFNKSNIHQVSS